MNHLGGEIQQGSLNSSMGYSVEAECTGKPEPIWSLIANQCRKPIGVGPYWRFQQPKTMLHTVKFNL